MEVAPGDAAYIGLRDAFLAHYAAALCVDSMLFAEVAAVLDALDARAMPWGIVTNKATRYTEPLLVSLRLSPRARTVICGDTTPHAKPHPAPLTEAATRLGVDPARCVYVGDARRDIEAGKAAGMRTLVARWGYLEPGDVPDDWFADGLLDAPGALLDWLRAADAR
jgi:phosphoglycolate phosphatase